MDRDTDPGLSRGRRRGRGRIGRRSSTPHSPPSRRNPNEDRGTGGRYHRYRSQRGSPPAAQKEDHRSGSRPVHRRHDGGDRPSDPEVRSGSSGGLQSGKRSSSPEPPRSESGGDNQTSAGNGGPGIPTVPEPIRRAVRSSNGRRDADDDADVPRVHGKYSDERERRLFNALAQYIDNVNATRWRPEWGPKPPGCNSKDHYALWRDAYDGYLWQLYGELNGLVNEFKVPLEGRDFESFAEFAYENSTGYISPYA